jgi:hypothetical protein
MDTLLKGARVELCGPEDARATRLAPDTIDMVYANSFMEHVPKRLDPGYFVRKQANSAARRFFTLWFATTTVPT